MVDYYFEKLKLNYFNHTLAIVWEDLEFVATENIPNAEEQFRHALSKIANSFHLQKEGNYSGNSNKFPYQLNSLHIVFNETEVFEFVCFHESIHFDFRKKCVLELQKEKIFTLQDTRIIIKNSRFFYLTFQEFREASYNYMYTWYTDKKRLVLTSFILQNSEREEKTISLEAFTENILIP
jgi:hypothetical protein